MVENSSGPGYRQRADIGLHSVDIGSPSSITDLSKPSTAKSADPFTAAKVPKHEQTILQSLAPGLDTKVATQNLDQYRLQAGGSIAASPRIEPNRHIVENVGTQISDTKAGITETLKQAQQEIATAAKAAGVDLNALFPRDDLTPRNETELAISVVTQMAGGVMGQGSLATAISGASGAAEIIGDRKGLKGKSPEEAIAAIRDKLIEAQNAAALRSAFSKASAMGAPAANPKEGPKAPLDWKTAFEQQGTDVIKQIATMNPNDPPEGMIPEWDALSRQEAQVADVKANLDYTDEHKFDAPSAAEIEVAVSHGNTDAIEAMVPDTAKVDEVHQTLPALRGIKLVPDDVDELTEEVKRITPVPRPTPVFAAGISGPSGNMAA